MHFNSRKSNFKEVEKLQDYPVQEKIIDLLNK